MKWNVLQNRWHQLPETIIRRGQVGRLRNYLRRVVLPFSAHYRRLFEQLGLSADSFGSLEDLQRVPFTPEQPQRVRDFIVTPDPPALARRPSIILRALLHGRQAVKDGFEAEFRPIFMTFTTGRSAEPTPVLYTQRDVGHLATAGRRMVEVLGARPEDRLLNILPFAPHLAFWLTHYAGIAGNLLTLSSGGGKVMGTEGNLRHIRKFKPDVIIGIPTFIYHLLHQAAEQGMHCENLKALVLAGEKVSAGLRQKLRDLGRELGARDLAVLATYGFTEAKLAWAECPFPHDQPSPGYHLYPDLGILEVVDPQTGRPLPPGQAGEIVFTPLDARGTVVLRYRTGDYTDGGLTYEPCPYCGRSLPRLVGNISRSSEIKEMNLDKIKGTLVDFNELEHVLDDAPHIGAWQVELRKANDDPHDLDEIILHVQKIDGTDETQVSEQLSRRCVEHLEIRPNRIVFHNAFEMRRLQGVGKLLKEQKLVDHRPQATPVTTSSDSAAASPTEEPSSQDSAESTEVTEETSG